MNNKIIKALNQCIPIFDILQCPHALYSSQKWLLMASSPVSSRFRDCCKWRQEKQSCRRAFPSVWNTHTRAQPTGLSLLPVFVTSHSVWLCQLAASRPPATPQEVPHNPQGVMTHSWGTLALSVILKVNGGNYSNPEGWKREPLRNTEL